MDFSEPSVGGNFEEAHGVQVSFQLASGCPWYIYRDAKLLHVLSVGFPLLLYIFYPKTISCCLVGLRLKVN